MKMEPLDKRVEFFRAFQELPTADPGVYLRSAEQQVRIDDAGSERAVDPGARLVQLSIAVEGPGERRLGREVLSKLQICPRPGHRRDAIPRHIGIVVREVMIIMYLAAPRGFQITGERPVLPIARGIR